MWERSGLGVKWGFVVLDLEYNFVIFILWRNLEDDVVFMIYEYFVLGWIESFF